ncbi:MAG: tyrosine-type recombinase/integrase [Candidatus Portnoybacteria bacterium]|nr:tyrosine-type recombinase/integrase [Candidatus Portnoybacteria bacterium]
MKKSSKPLPQHLNDFLDWLDIEKGLSNKSQENYSRFLKKFIDWLKENNLEDLKPHQLSPAHIWNYRVYLSRQSKKPLKKSTQNYYLIALRSLLNYFTNRDILSLPAEKIKLAKDKGERQVRFLNLEQLEKLFSAPDISKVQELRDRAILESLFSTGMRIAELVSLNRDQIKIKSGIEELELSIVGKGGRIRTVYFSERALSWLRKYLKTRRDNENALFINYRSKKGASKRLTPRYIEKSLKKYVVISGLPLTTTPHVMRHSFSTDLLSQGVDLRILQEFLGHKSILATQIYAHVTSKKLREIHQKFHSGKKLK